ncbi:SdpC family antimicrobial peptide [Rathayibacter agropyri]
MNKRIITLVVAATTVVGTASIITVCQPGATSASAATVEEAHDPAQRGQKVFEALFFLQGGDSTHALLKNADVSSLTDDEIETVLQEVAPPESVAKVQQIEKELTASDAEYFSRLGATVLDGDPVEVQQLLTSAYDQMLQTPTMAEAVQSLEAEKTHVPGEVGTDCGVAVVVALGAVIAVTAVAAVNYALAANIALGFNVAAGTNVAYQNNAVETKSAVVADTSDRFSDGIVAAVIEQFGR